jgi:hypothetical protein
MAIMMEEIRNVSRHPGNMILLTVLTVPVHRAGVITQEEVAGAEK